MRVLRRDGLYLLSRKRHDRDGSILHTTRWSALCFVEDDDKSTSPALLHTQRKLHKFPKFKYVFARNIDSEKLRRTKIYQQLVRAAASEGKACGHLYGQFYIHQRLEEMAIVHQLCRLSVCGHLNSTHTSELKRSCGAMEFGKSHFAALSAVVPSSLQATSSSVPTSSSQILLIPTSHTNNMCNAFQFMETCQVLPVFFT
jgi:hypothetical protein